METERLNPQDPGQGYIGLRAFTMPKNSKWKCYLFGSRPEHGNKYIFIPSEGHEPNWFWRKMQYLAFGNLWVKDKD